MTINDFIELINEGSDVIYTLFDCNAEELISMNTDEFDNATEFSRDDLLFCKYAYYEINSVDTWIGAGCIHIEFNIEV